MADHINTQGSSRPAGHVMGVTGIATNETQRTTEGPVREGWPSGI